jgi:hypothetical protein
MTGVEAVSNGVPLFSEPTVANAERTLTIIVGTLSVFLLGVGYLCPVYHIIAMNERQPGYQTILSQLIAAVAGRGTFYYVASASIFVVLTYSAQTSFADFPRVCRLLAEDDYLPPVFANKGRRLVFSHGIVLLTILSAVILVAFGGVTERLIPLFAVGAFSAFSLSQIGMIVYWLRKPGPGSRPKLICNAIGAAVTSIALATIIVTKFVEGAWITVLVVPMLVLLLRGIRRHYDKLEHQVAQPLNLKGLDSHPPLVIIAINNWNRVAQNAIRFGLTISDKVVAVHVARDGRDQDQLRKLWDEKVAGPAEKSGFTPPTLHIVESPYRRLYEPILSFIHQTRKAEPDRIIAVIIPELMEPHWYEYLLHNMHATRLRALIDEKADERTFVITTAWRLREA